MDNVTRILALIPHDGLRAVLLCAYAQWLEEHAAYLRGELD